ncbi:MAG: hypothetical protein K9J12_00245 [Melioribacteraceae bacterium]|nr:hypothetical protein [Melioribacteraceae bacterium]MCF8265022.1 hypothetical protein [Melioribacteraceae bacterium]MCF8413815.1 hypothetical protein [Melioribacteraceae bacterium]
MKKTILILLIAIIISPAISIIAQPFNTCQKFGQEKMKEMLKLTDDQETNLENLRFNHAEEMIELKAELEKHKLSVKKMMQSGDILPDNLMEKTEEGLALHSKMKKLQTQHWIDVYNLLDETQKEIWTEHFGQGRGMNCMAFGQHNRFGQRNHLGKNRGMFRPNRFD